MNTIMNEINCLTKDGYVIVQSHKKTDDEIIHYFTEFNKKLGCVQLADTKKYDDITDNIWVNIKYDINFPSNKPWNSNTFIKLHTDNTNTNADLTELICLTPSQYSGHTCLIKNEKVVELIKFLDDYENNNLFERILNCEINFPTTRKILEIKERPIFCFNYTQAMKFNNEKEDIIKEFDDFLQKITLSNLMTEIKLERGDALIFDDSRFLHGRRSIIGSRHYLKCGINNFANSECKDLL